MTNWLSNLILAEDNGTGWGDYSFLIVIAIIFLLRNLGNIIKAVKENAEKNKQQEQPKPFYKPQKRRYSPLDHQGRPIKQAGRKETEILPVDSSRRHSPEQMPQPTPIQTEPIAPANAKIMPKHDHTREFAAIKRYKERIAKQKALAAQKQRLAQQIKLKAAKPQSRPKSVRSQEPELIPVVETVQPQTGFTIDTIKENKENLRTAIVLNEILSKPISLRN